ncbi:MAG: DUF3800 domain-containing protein [Clostridiaceae bacterium]
MGWRNRPTNIENWPAEVDEILFLDENGDATLKHIMASISKGVKVAQNNRYFTVTGCSFDSSYRTTVRANIMAIKNKYWPDGKHIYKKNEKRVCFHSREIRSRTDAFDPKNVDYDNFIFELSSFMKNEKFKIFSSTLDKVKLCTQYKNPENPYDICLKFIMERFVRFHLPVNKTAIVVLESRGKKEDRCILEYLKNLIDYGTCYIDASLFKKIKGVYFNPKWNVKDNEQTSYYGLEIADLVSFPIYKNFSYQHPDLAYDSIENKIYGFPHHFGKGLKIFPK